MGVTIALTGQFAEAVQMASLLEELGFHPDPIQPNMQVTALGGERGYRITVPEGEATKATSVLQDQGFEKCL